MKLNGQKERIVKMMMQYKGERGMEENPQLPMIENHTQ